MGRAAQRAVVLGVGSLSILVGLGSAGVLVWVLARGGGEAPVGTLPAEVTHAVEVMLPPGHGALLWVPAGWDVDGQRVPSHLRLVHPDGTSVALSEVDIRSRAAVDLWWEEDEAPRLWLEDGARWWSVRVDEGVSIARERGPEGRARPLGTLYLEQANRRRWVELGTAEVGASDE